jgi:ribosomal protein S18 acetylase RimI-like enzyme
MFVGFRIREVDDEELEEIADLIMEIFPDANLDFSDLDRVFVVENNQELVGFAHITDDDKRVIIRGFGVSENYRNFGAGSALMEKILELCELSDRPVYLKVKALNPAIHLYERYGFCLKKFGGAAHVIVKRMPS